VFCPECGAEYILGVARCHDCHVPLVDELPQAESRTPEPSQEPMPVLDLSEPLDLVTVFACGDPGRVALAKSLLQSAEIPFVASNEAMQDLIGWGRFPLGANVALGPAQLHVRRDDAEDARTLLGDLASDLPSLRRRLGRLRRHS